MIKPEPKADFSRCCVHTITTKPWSLREAAENYAAAGIRGITVWRDVLEGAPVSNSHAIIESCGLEIVALCRGGFFPGIDAASRQRSIDDNRQALDEAAELGAPIVVLVCGAHPGQPLADSRQQIRDGIEAVLPHARACGVKLAIEPLHPMYADNRSAINTLAQANAMAEAIASPNVGVAVDVYHLWWDPDLEAGIRRCGDHGNLLAFHVCDWKTPTTDLLLDRGLMGEGCIDIPRIRNWVESAGFDGFIEVEIFSTIYWESEQAGFLEKIKDSYLTYV